MKIAFVADISEFQYTGPRNSVTMLARYINELTAHQAAVFTSPKDNEFHFNEVGVSPLNSVRSLEKYDVVVFAGFFKPFHLKVAFFCKLKGIPYIISPRSSLMKASYKRSPLKKWLFLLLGGFAYIKCSESLHFLSVDEKAQSYNFSHPSFVAPNIATVRTKPKAVSDLETRIVGFLGRFDVFHKGLDRLLDAVVEYKDAYREKSIKFLLAGPDFRGGRQFVESRIEAYRVSDIVSTQGALKGVEKDTFLDKCFAFVHCSRFEGQPQAVIEAMAAGLPVLVTKGTNMQSCLVNGNAGVCLSDDSQLLAFELFQALTTDDSELRLKARLGAEVAQHDFSPDIVVKQFCAQIEAQESFR